MYSKYHKSILLFLAVFFVHQCSVALYVPTADDALKSGYSLDSLNTGREYYMNRCASCHYLYLPASYTSEEWQPIVERMEVRSGLLTGEKELIIGYLNAGSKTAAPENGKEE